VDLAAAADVILAQESSQGSWMELDGRPGLAPCLHFVQTLHREPTVYKYVTLQMTWLKLHATHSEREEREREKSEKTFLTKAFLFGKKQHSPLGTIKLDQSYFYMWFVVLGGKQ